MYKQFAFLAIYITHNMFILKNVSAHDNHKTDSDVVNVFNYL